VWNMPTRSRFSQTKIREKTVRRKNKETKYKKSQSILQKLLEENFFTCGKKKKKKGKRLRKFH